MFFPDRGIVHLLDIKNPQITNEIKQDIEKVDNIMCKDCEKYINDNFEKKFYDYVYYGIKDNIGKKYKLSCSTYVTKNLFIPSTERFNGKILKGFILSLFWRFQFSKEMPSKFDSTTNELLRLALYQNDFKKLNSIRTFFVIGDYSRETSSNLIMARFGTNFGFLLVDNCIFFITYDSFNLDHVCKFEVFENADMNIGYVPKKNWDKLYNMFMSATVSHAMYVIKPELYAEMFKIVINAKKIKDFDQITILEPIKKV